MWCSIACSLCRCSMARAPNTALTMLAQGKELKLPGTGSTGGMGGPEHSSAQESCPPSWRSHSPLIPPNKQKYRQQSCQHLLRLSLASSVRIKQKADAASSSPREFTHWSACRSLRRDSLLQRTGANHPKPLLSPMQS